jgi:hypothetical protein
MCLYLVHTRVQVCTQFLVNNAEYLLQQYILYCTILPTKSISSYIFSEIREIPSPLRYSRYISCAGILEQVHRLAESIPWLPSV